LTLQLDRIEQKLDQLIRQMGLAVALDRAQLKEGEIIMAELDDLRVQVAKNSDVEDSALLLIQGIAAKLTAAIAAGDPAALRELEAQLKTHADALAAAVAANTTV
jgi:hypothetical protein